MKKIFTLIATAFVAMNVFAASSYTFQKGDAAGGTVTAVDGLTIKFTTETTNPETSCSWASDKAYATPTADGGIIEFITTKAGKLELTLGGDVNTSKKLIMTDGENGLTATVSSTGAQIESNTNPAATIASGDGIIYTLEANKTYRFAISGTKYRITSVSYTDGQGGGSSEDIITLSTNNQIVFTETYAKGSFNGKTVVAGDLKMKVTDKSNAIEVDGNKASFGTLEENVAISYRFKTGGKSQASNSLTLTVPSDGNLYIYARTGSNSAKDRNIQVIQNGQTLVDKILLEADAVKQPYVDSNGENKELTIYPIITASVQKGDVSIAYPVGSINIYGIAFGQAIPTAIKNVETTTAASVKKSVRNGQIVIETANGTFNAVGAQVK